MNNDKKDRPDKNWSGRKTLVGVIGLSIVGWILLARPTAVSNMIKAAENIVSSIVPNLTGPHIDTGPKPPFNKGPKPSSPPAPGN
jgi:hypothetical protein